MAVNNKISLDWFTYSSPNKSSYNWSDMYGQNIFGTNSKYSLTADNSNFATYLLDNYNSGNLSENQLVNLWNYGNSKTSSGQDLSSLLNGQNVSTAAQNWGLAFQGINAAAQTGLGIYNAIMSWKQYEKDLESYKNSLQAYNTNLLNTATQYNEYLAILANREANAKGLSSDERDTYVSKQLTTSAGRTLDTTQLTSNLK